jgi:hypothetical protein
MKDMKFMKTDQFSKNRPISAFVFFMIFMVNIVRFDIGLELLLAALNRLHYNYAMQQRI